MVRSDKPLCEGEGLSSATPNWIWGPTFRCVSLVAEEVKIASMLYHAVFAFANLEAILKAAGQHLRRAGQSDAAVTKLIAANKTLGTWAKDLVKDDYQAVTVHSLIGLWATVEVAVEDTATLILVNDPDALTHVEAEGVKLPKDLSKPLNEADARRVYKRLEGHGGKEVGIGESYCRILSVLGVKVRVTPEATATLSELNYVRNCFLHRGGAVDERAAKEAPNLGVPLGDKIRISEGQAKRYLKGVSDFTMALLTGVQESRHNPVARR